VCLHFAAAELFTPEVDGTGSQSTVTAGVGLHSEDVDLFTTEVFLFAPLVISLFVNYCSVTLDAAKSSLLNISELNGNMPDARNPFVAFSGTVVFNFKYAERKMSLMS